MTTRIRGRRFEGGIARIKYSLSEAAQAMADSQKMTARDVLDVARFALGFMIIPLLMTALYVAASCI